MSHLLVQMTLRLLMIVSLLLTSIPNAPALAAGPAEAEDSAVSQPPSIARTAENARRPDAVLPAPTRQAEISATLYLPLITRSGPNVAFSAEPRVGSVPLTVTFTNHSASSYQNYLWDFGDQSTSTAVNPVHVYDKGGVFTVTLTASDGTVTGTQSYNSYITVDLIPAGTISSSGGAITSTNGQVRLDFAPGAISETLDIFIQPTNLLDKFVGSDGRLIQDLPTEGLPFQAIELTAERPGTAIPLADLYFQAPVTMTFAYTTTDLKGLIESSLTFVYHNPLSQTYDLVPTVVHSDTSQLTGVLTHFSDYGVTGDKATWTTPALDAFNVALAKGSASYSYDIPLPAGPKGLKPKLTLAYNSGIVNGLFGDGSSDGSWLGTGWTLELGHITWQIAGYDKPNKSNIYGFNLTLNGVSEELIKVKTGNGAEEFTFHTEHETFMKIEPPANVMDPEQAGTWKVTDKNGTAYYFGDPNQRAGTILGSWSRGGRGRGRRHCELNQMTFKLYKVVDLHGNTINFSYTPFPGVDGCQGEGSGDDSSFKDGPASQSYPQTIRYATNPNAGDTHAEYRVEFKISPKGYLSGNTRGDINSKLDDINLKYVSREGPEQFVRRLHFEYLTDVTHPWPWQRKHLLVELQIFDAVQGGNSLPPTRFTYEERNVGSLRYERDNCKDCDPVYTKRARPFLSTISNGYGGTIQYTYQPVQDDLFQVVARRTIKEAVGDFQGTYHYQFHEANVIQDLSGMIYPGSKTWGYINYSRFFGFGRATEIDPLSNRTEHYYDNSYQFGPMISWDIYWDGEPGILNGYELSTWVYDSAGKLYRVSWPTWIARPSTRSVKQVTYVYQSEQKDYQCDGKITATPRNPAGLNATNCVIQRKTFGYDFNTGNVLKQTEYGNNGSTPYRSTVNEYAPNFNRQLLNLPYRQTLRPGDGSSGQYLAETLFYYDRQALATAPVNGDLTAKREWTGSGYVATDYGDYDSYGNAQLVTTYGSYGTASSTAPADPRSTTTRYDDQGLRPITVTNPLSHTTVAHYDYRFQLPLWEEDANHAQKTYLYDGFGRLRKVWLPGGCSDGQPTFEAQYADQVGYRETARQRLSCAESDSYANTYVFYDGLGRKLQAQTPGDKDNQFIINNLKYDALGRVLFTSVAYEGNGGSGNYWAPDWSHGYTESRYDPLGRVVSVKQPDGATLTTAYQGLRTTTVDANGHQKISENDSLGRIVKVEEYSGISPTVTLYATTSYQYDPQDNLLTVTDHLNNQTQLTYDALKRKTSMRDPDMGHWSYAYDPAGNLAHQTDARNKRICLYYDVLNRLVGKSYPTTDSCPSAPTFNTYSVYDQGSNSLGRRTQLVDAAGTVTWQYDIRGRVLSEARHFAGAYEGLDNRADPTTDYVTRYTYDDADRVVSSRYPDGEVVTTTYTARSLPINLTSSWGTSYLAGAEYNALAKPTLHTAGNGLTTVYHYYLPAEANSRLKRIQLGSWLDLTYQYDQVGNLKQLLDDSQSAAGEVLRFDYDHLDRLTGAQTSGSVLPVYTEAYTYNEIGNLLSRQVSATQTLSYAYDTLHRHAAIAAGPNRYTYDAAGNMLTRLENSVTYRQTWNVENLLEQVTWLQGSQTYTSTFIYDGDNQRLLKIEQHGTPGGPLTETTTIHLKQAYEEQLQTSNLIPLATDKAAVPAAELPLPAGSDRRTTPASEPASESGNPELLPSSPSVSNTLPLPEEVKVALPAGSITATVVAVSGLGDQQRTLTIPPIFLPLQQALATILAQYMPYLSYSGSVEDLILDRMAWQARDGGSHWTNPNYPALPSGWTTATSSCPASDVPPGSVVLGPCTAADHALVATSFFREPFALRPPIGYGLRQVRLQPWTNHASGWRSDNSHWYVNGNNLALTSGVPVSIDISSKVHLGTGNLLAVQTGNRPHYAWPQHDNPTGTAWRIWAEWSYLGNPIPALTGLPLYSRGGLAQLAWSNTSGYVPDVSYVLQRSTDHTFQNPIASQTVTTTTTNYSWNGLPDGQTHYFRVASYSAVSNQYSNWSNIVSTTMDSTPPTIVMVSPGTPFQNSLSFTVRWSGNDPIPAGGVTASGLAPLPYQLSYRSSITNVWVTLPATHTTSLNFNGTDLTTYAFKVSAKDRAGNHAVSPIITTTIDLYPPQVGDFSATPRFISPNGDGTADTTLLTATVSLVPADWQLSILSNATTYRTFSGSGIVTALWDGRNSEGTLVPDGSYTVLLTATNAVGNQVTNSVASLVGVDTQPPTITLSVLTANSGSFQLSWSGSDPAPTSGLLGYHIQYGEALTSTIQWQGWLTATQQTAANYSGSLGHRYYFRARVWDYAKNQSNWVQVGPYQVNYLVTKYYLFGARPGALRQGDVVYYLHGDHLGSTSLTTNENGQAVSQQRYLPYGQIRWESGVTPTDFGFTGQRLESGFGLMDYNARYYDPLLARFISPDSMVPEPGNSQSLNRYSYVLNRPLQGGDPTGHQGPDDDDDDDDDSTLVDVLKSPPVVAYIEGNAKRARRGAELAAALLQGKAINMQCKMDSSVFELKNLKTSQIVRTAVGYAVGGIEGLETQLLAGTLQGDALRTFNASMAVKWSGKAVGLLENTGKAFDALDAIGAASELGQAFGAAAQGDRFGQIEHASAALGKALPTLISAYAPAGLGMWVGDTIATNVAGTQSTSEFIQQTSMTLALGGYEQLSGAIQNDFQSRASGWATAATSVWSLINP